MKHLLNVCALWFQDGDACFTGTIFLINLQWVPLVLGGQSELFKLIMAHPELPLTPSPVSSPLTPHALIQDGLLFSFPRRAHCLLPPGLCTSCSLCLAVFSFPLTSSWLTLTLYPGVSSSIISQGRPLLTGLNLFSCALSAPLPSCSCMSYWIFVT